MGKRSKRNREWQQPKGQKAATPTAAYSAGAPGSTKRKTKSSTSAIDEADVSMPSLSEKQKLRSTKKAREREEEEGFYMMLSDDDDGNQHEKYDPDIGSSILEEEEDEEDVGEDEEAEFDFDVKEMQRGDIPDVGYFLSQTIPDVEGKIDVEQMAEAALSCPLTCLVKVATGASEDVYPVAVLGNNEGQPEELLGIFSFLDVAKMATRQTLLDALSSRPTYTISSGLHPAELLTKEVKVKGKASQSKAVLLLNDRVRTLPDVIPAQIHAHTIEEVRTLKSDKAQHFCVNPSDYFIVVMAKIQRGVDAKEATRAEPSGKLINPSSGKKAKKKRHEQQQSFELSDFIFWRSDDEEFFKRRDPRISCVVHKFRKQYDEQPEREIPLCVLFGLHIDQFVKAVEQLDLSSPL